MISLASTPVSGSKVIFVSERNEVSPLDYMVDGVIVVTFLKNWMEEQSGEWI